MATYYSSYNNTYRLRVETTLGTQSIDNNYTPVNWYVYLEFGSKTFNGIVETGYLNVDGVRVWTAPGSYNFTGVYNQSRLLASGTRNIAHNTDGTRSFSISARFQATSGGWGPGLLSIDTSETLPTIPRATTPTASNGTLGSALTISTPRASSSFTHTLKYKYGSSTGTIATGVATSRSWTPPVSLASNFPKATSGTCVITCETYSGSTLVGSKAITINLSIPTSVVPSISGATLTETVSGLAAQFAAFVKNKSKVRIQTTAAGAYGSTISAVRVSVDGTTYSGSNIITNPIRVAGTFSEGVVITVTDSRGRTATRKFSITIVDWVAPRINSFSARRANASGTLVDDGWNARVYYNYAIAPVGNKNNSSWKVERWTGSAWSQLSSGTGYSANTNFLSGAVFNPDQSHQLKLTVADYFQSYSAEFTLPTSSNVLDVRSTKKGLAIGKASEKDAFEVAWPSEFLSTVKVGGSLAVTEDSKTVCDYAVSFASSNLVNLKTDIKAWVNSLPNTEHRFYTVAGIWQGNWAFSAMVHLRANSEKMIMIYPYHSTANFMLYTYGKTTWYEK